jgi:hypothetical protein
MESLSPSADTNFDLLTKFREEYPLIFNRAKEITKDYETLIKIYANLKLFNKIIRSGCIIFADLIRAILTMETAADDTLLIQFTDIDLCGIFSPDQYLNFLRNISDTIEDRNIKVNLYQVVISGKKQKLVFACTDVSFFEKLQKYARDCFQAVINNSSNQITVNVIAANENELIENYNKLYNYISGKKDSACCESMKQVQLLQDIRLSYRKYSCNDTLAAKTLEQLIPLLRTIHSTGPINITINNNLGTINNFAAETDNDAVKWIKNNPPKSHEYKIPYFARYKNDDGKLSPNIFGKVMKGLGYSTGQDRGGRYWL